jgi:phenylalanyl-tRNA synthetase beta chain
MLVSRGVLEARPMPFVAGGSSFVRVSNPISENEAYLRREILDTLARRAEYNLARMQGDVRMFEIGSVFAPHSGQLPTEELHVGVLVMGRRQPPHFTDPKSSEFETWASYDEWDLKGIAEELARSAYPAGLIALASSANPGELWRLTVDGRDLGAARHVTLDAPPWAARAFGVELSLGLVDSSPVAPEGESAHRPFVRPVLARARYQPLPTTPAAEIDLALLVPDAVRGEQVEAIMRRISGKLLEHVELFDRYVGGAVEPGQRSLAWRLTFRHAERTLRDRELDARRTDILRALADELNVRPRSS